MEIINDINSISNKTNVLLLLSVITKLMLIIQAIINKKNKEDKLNDLEKTKLAKVKYTLQYYNIIFEKNKTECKK